MPGDHSCRICTKTFPSGRSLGGHMRSHVISTTSAPDAHLITSAAGYGLRENRRKTWRLNETAAPDGDRLCRECGKAFPSWNALFGHMRCHSASRSAHEEEPQQDDDDEEFEAYSEVVPRRRPRSRRVAAITVSSSSVSESEEHQLQEEVAYSLMMLSRDVAGCSVWSSESSDKHSAAKSELNSDDGFGVLEPKRKETAGPYDSDVEILHSTKKSKLNEQDCLQVGVAKYHCSTCKKGFNTYQALGGHRASHHKKLKGCLSENSVEIDSNGEIRIDGKKVKGHECPICHRMFISGQALGGHKRSHMIHQQQQQQQQVQSHELIDLNLPAPEASASTTDGNLEPWWMGHTNNLFGVNLMTN